MGVNGPSYIRTQVGVKKSEDSLWCLYFWQDVINREMGVTVCIKHALALLMKIKKNHRVSCIACIEIKLCTVVYSVTWTQTRSTMNIVIFKHTSECIWV